MVEHRAALSDAHAKDAVRETIQRARRLYGSEYRPNEVSETIEELGSILLAFIPTGEYIADRVPPGRERDRTKSSLETARHLMRSGPAPGDMSKLVHMQLLADSVAVLSALVNAPGTSQ